MYFLAIVALILLQSVVTYSLEFCDNSTQNPLIDSIFSFNDTIYAFRKPDSVWILRVDANSGNWSQIGNDMPLRQVFKSYGRNWFDAGFSVSDFVGCDASDVRCLYNDPHFDATNITFLFFKQQFFIYRRVDETRFEPINWSSNNTIPWKLNQRASTDINQIFAIKGRIDAALYRRVEGEADDSPKRKVVLFSNSSVIEYELTDDNIISKDTTIRRSPALTQSGNGGFVDAIGDNIFIVGNNVYKYVSGNTYLDDLQKSSWDYFNCHSMLIITTTAMSSTDSTFDTTTDSTNGTANGTSDEITTDTFDDTMDTSYETVSESTTVSVTEEDSDKTETTQETNGEQTDSSKPTKPAISGMHIDEDQDYRSDMLSLVVIAFIFVSITTVLVTIFTFYGFKILT